MEYDINTLKYIVMDTDITYSLDFNGFPREVVIFGGQRAGKGFRC